MANQGLELKELQVPYDCLLQIFFQLEKNKLVSLRFLNRWFAKEIQKIVRKKWFSHLDGLFLKKEIDMTLWYKNVLSFYQSIMKGNWIVCEDQPSCNEDTFDSEIHRFKDDEKSTFRRTEEFYKTPFGDIIVTKTFDVTPSSTSRLGFQFSIEFRNSKVSDVRHIVATSWCDQWARQAQRQIWMFQDCLYILSMALRLDEDNNLREEYITRNLILEKFQFQEHKFRKTDIYIWDLPFFVTWNCQVFFRGPLMFFFANIESSHFLNLVGFDMITFKPAKLFLTKFIELNDGKCSGKCIHVSCCDTSSQVSYRVQ